MFMLGIDQELRSGAPLYLAMIGLDEDGSVPALFDARFEVQAIAVARQERPHETIPGRVPATPPEPLQG